mgnify:CR=1 FL=1
MKLPISVFCILSFSASVIAQTDTTIWSAIQKAQANEYMFSYPDRWKKYEFANSATKELKFDFSGVGIPAMYNSSPVTGMFSMKINQGTNQNSMEDFVITEINSVPDKVQGPGKNYYVDTLTIQSGEKGILYSAHYYRRSKAFNISRYDMVVYSEKRNTTYWLSSIIQYKDASYKLAEELKLKAYLSRVYQSLLLR